MMPVGGRARDHLGHICCMDRPTGPMFTGFPFFVSISRLQSGSSGRLGAGTFN
jgi:hypothetical protein